MQLMKVEELIPHKRNSEFFDDMSGEKWQEFLESVKTSGVIEPIVITQDKVIVSGHQRVRACKELGITEILAEVRVYDSEDKVLKDLLETNIRQRGSIGGSDIKLGRRIKELERIYGIKNGNNQYKEGFSLEKPSQKTQETLLKELGITQNTYHSAKKLATLPLEIQELVEQGNISSSTASRLISKLNPEQQEELIKSLPTTEKLTQKQVQGYIDKLKETQNQMNSYKIKAEKADELQSKVAELEHKLELSNNNDSVKLDLEKQIKEYKIKISELLKEKNEIERQKTKIVTERVEVDKPETLASIKELKEKLSENKQYSQKLYDDLIEKTKLLNQAMGSSTNYQLVSHCSEVTLKMLNFIKEMAQYDYMAESFNEIPDATRNEYVRCITSVKKWADNILNVINQSKIFINVNLE